MPEKAPTAASYGTEQLALVRGACLYLATKLGDVMEDLVVVGGLVPSLLIDSTADTGHAEAHVGTMDLDIGLAAALLEQRRYRDVSDRLRGAGFLPDRNEAGNPTAQRWRLRSNARVTIDFLIPPTLPDDRGGALRNLERDFAAVITPGLHLALRDRENVTLSGRTILGEEATRDVWVCGAGAFVVLKALAFDARGENKDAYDLFYVVRNYGTGVGSVRARLAPLLDDDTAKRALSILRRDFLDSNQLGPRRVAAFLAGRPDAGIQADVVGFIADLIDGLG